MVRGRPQRLGLTVPFGITVEPRLFTITGLLAVHIILGPQIAAHTQIATAHALGTLLFGLIWTRLGQQVHRVAWVCAYIAGAEVLWRMGHAAVFWEFGKYSLILLAGLGLVNGGERLRRANTITFLLWAYVVLLLPSVALSVNAIGFSKMARQLISFNLSGPLALAVCGAFFSRWLPSTDQLKWLLWGLIFPVASVAAAVLRGIVNTESIVFSMNASSAASGGFGPNQVSAVLGLGVFAALVLIPFDSRPQIRAMCLGLASWFLAQGVLTFSRGGIFNVVVALAVFGVHSVSNRRARRGIFLAIVVFGLVGPYIIFPRIDTFTGGAVRGRFTDVNTTGRKEMAEADLRIWEEHLIAGVGPGMGMVQRGNVKGIAAHTELTRLLAEHGFLGLVAMVMLGVAGWLAYSVAPPGIPRGWVASMIAWSFAEMLHSAMRLGVISLVFALGLVSWTSLRKSKIPWRSGTYHGLDR